MIEAAKIWNEPNNKSHWDLQIDPEWTRFAQMAVLAGKAIHAVNPRLTRVLGGMSPIDPGFINRMKAYGVLDHVDAVAAALPVRCRDRRPGPDRPPGSRGTVAVLGRQAVPASGPAPAWSGPVRSCR